MSKQNKSAVLDVLNITLRLFAICTVVALVVAGVNSITKDRIAEQEWLKTTEALDSAFGEGTEYVPIDFTSKNTVTSLYEARKDGECIGYGLLCEPSGFKDVIKMMVSFDGEKKITAVRVISLAETAGIGDKVKSDPSFAEQFVGKKDSVELGKDGISAIAGSTISSKAVTKGVNDAINTMKTLEFGKEDAANG